MDVTSRRWTQKNARFNTQNRQLRDLARVRFGYDLSIRERENWLQQQGVEPERQYYNPELLGQLLNFTVEEDVAIKCRKGQFPGAFCPSDETSEQAKKRRHEYGKPHRAEQQRNRRIATKARLVSVLDIDCRTSAVFMLLSPQWIDVADLMKGLGRSPAFRKVDGSKFLKGNSLRTAILRELESLVKVGKAERVKQMEKHGLTKFRFRLRRS
jgi:hypothetical protein